MLARWLPLLAALFISGCANLDPGLSGEATRAPGKVAEDWPAELPPREHYRRLYAADKANHAHQSENEYLLWVRRFFTGWGPIPGGWNDTTAQVLYDTAPDQYVLASAKMAYLGRIVSGEWAKKSPARRIHNATASTWGQGLAAISERGPDAVARYLDRVRADAEALLQGQLDHLEITRERYVVASGS